MKYQRTQEGGAWIRGCCLVWEVLGMLTVFLSGLQARDANGEDEARGCQEGRCSSGERL